MPRISTILIWGAISVLAVILLGLAALLIGRGFLQISDQNASYPTIIPSIMAATVDLEITPSNTVSSGATEESATAVPPMTSTSPAATPTTSTTPTVDATAVPPMTSTSPVATSTTSTVPAVAATSVQYVMAQTDLNIRSGPGTDYGAVGWVAAGQIAKVTGVSGDSAWWRILCPDGSVGSCWLTARDQYTQPTTAPGASPTATSGLPSCTDSAALVADLTVPDGTQLLPNTGFNKTWRIKNTGTCTWDHRYKLVHAGGHLMGAISTGFSLPGIVAPGQSIDLTVSLVSPAASNTYQSDWKLQNPGAQPFGVGRNSSPFWVKIVVSGAPTTIISGVVYQDADQNGVYNNGEKAISGLEVWLVPGTACHVRQDAVATSLSDGNGRYTLSGNYSGSYCVGLVGENGLDDVASVAVAAGQTLYDINLRAPISGGTISGFLWADYCLTNEDGDALDGDCQADGNGDYHADGMIQPTETYIPGVTILLQAGTCATDNPVAMKAVTDAAGRYTFLNLNPGTYCVSMNAASPENAPLLLPGDWTFPSRGIWYQQITLAGLDDAYPVNFGWDYQLR